MNRQFLKGFSRVRYKLDAMVLCGFGLFANWQSCLLPTGSFRAPGPGFFPLGLSGMIVLLSFVLLVKKGQKSAPSKIQLRKSSFNVALTFVGLIGYSLLLKPLGFLLATSGLTYFLLGVVQRVRWRMSLTLAILVTFAASLFFGRFLGVPFPRGFLGV